MSSKPTARELESRRRFTEAILESIPTGVISLSPDGRIQRVNRALHGLFPEDQIERAVRLADLFPPEDVTEIEYLMKRARRTGVAASQIDVKSPRQVLHLAVTVSALPARPPRDHRIRRAARRHQRTVARAESRRLARSGAPHRA